MDTLPPMPHTHTMTVSNGGAIYGGAMTNTEEPQPRWELTIAECARLTGRDIQMIRYYIRKGILKTTRKVTGGQRPYWLVDGLSLGNLVAKSRPHPGRKGPVRTRFLTGAARAQALEEPDPTSTDG